MAKIVSIFITALLLVFITSFSTFATADESRMQEGEIAVVLDGDRIAFDVKPTINNGTTLVPIRAISEALESTVEWDEDTRTVTINKDDTAIKLCIDSPTMYVDENAVTLNHPAVIIDGRTLVPIRAISEAFGCLVGWDEKVKQVSVIADTLEYRMLYTPDGRAKSFHSSLTADQINDGWYEEPVQILYAPDKSEVFKKSEVEAQLGAGWYEEPVQTLYALGRSKVFKKSEVAGQLEKGWSEEPVKPVKICIDAGHFGKNNYSPVYPSYYESVMSWKLHLLLKKELEAYGFEVITTREDRNVDLEYEMRGGKAEGCDLFLSLHSNACEVEREDKAVIIPFQDLPWTDIDDKSREIAEKLGTCIRDVMGLSSYQIYPRKDDEDNDRDGNGVLDDEYYTVLYAARKVGTPGVIVEHGFHTNTRCAKWLSDDNNLEKLAKAEAAAIAEYFSVKAVEGE